MPMKHKIALAIAVAVPIGSAVVGSVATGDAVKNWYPRLLKSKLIIPLWAFIPVALLYYLLCGRILYRLLTIDAAAPGRTTALLLVGSMMAANEGWNYVFLGRRSVRGGFIGMIGYSILTLTLYRHLRHTDPHSARILLPYVGWLGYDLVYSYELWRLNPSVTASPILLP